MIRAQIGSRRATSHPRRRARSDTKAVEHSGPRVQRRGRVTDIIVALILAGITLYLADIGMGVSLISLSDAEKSRVRTKFRVLLLVSLVLIAAQGMRTYTAQMQAEVEQKRREQ